LLPVDRAVAGALVPGVLGEGLQQHRRESISLPPVGRQKARSRAWNLNEDITQHLLEQVREDENLTKTVGERY
jgi:hypothetical protein